MRVISIILFALKTMGGLCNYKLTTFPEKMPVEPEFFYINTS